MATSTAAFALTVFATLFATRFAVEASSLWSGDASGVGLLSLFLGAPPSDDPRCNKAEKSCDGCNVQVNCRTVNGYLYFVGNTTCDGNTPYCNVNDGSCTSNATLAAANCSSAQPVTSVQCPKQSGYFPDFTSCTKYYICSEWNAYSMDCSAYPNTVYSQLTKTCVPRTGAQSCFTPTCKKGALLTYTPDPRIYALCVDSTAANAVIGACNEGQTFNVEAGVCKAACLTAGRFKVDDKTYTECVDLGSNKLSLPVRRTCPGSSKFDADTQRCKD